ncbi:M13 family metallopeptidase, partial [bacterium]|nr:M13 family metallopeptidase [bacterium]
MKLFIYLIFLFSFLFLENDTLAKNTLSGINPDEFNYLTRPQDSLYDHINSEWLNNTPIPDDQIGWGSYMTLREESYSNQRKLIEEIIKKIEQKDLNLSDEEIKIGNLYKSYMDRESINKLGFQPIAEGIKKISQIKNTKDLWDYFSYSIKSGPSVPFTIAIYDDLKDPLNYTVYIDQSGLGLPDRDYYFEDNYKKARDAYITHIENLLTLIEVGKEKKRAS